MEVKKTCTKCRTAKPLNGFHKAPMGKLGRNSVCKDCISLAKAAKRAEDPSAARDQANARYARDPERYRRQQRDRYAADPGRARELGRRRAAKRRAVAAGAVFGAVAYERLLAQFPDCYLCGQPWARGSVEWDHVVPLSQGGAHSTQNLRPTHDVCNLRKHARPLVSLAWYNGSTVLGAWTVRPASCTLVSP